MMTIIAKILVAKMIMVSLITGCTTTTEIYNPHTGTGIRIVYNYAGEETHREEIEYDYQTNEWIVKE